MLDILTNKNLLKKILKILIMYTFIDLDLIRLIQKKRKTLPYFKRNQIIKYLGKLLLIHLKETLLFKDLLMKNSEEENKIIKNIQKGIDTSQNLNKILDLHSNIFYKICNKYMYSSFNFHREDFLMDKNLFIYQCLLDYKFDKGAKFSTYLASRVKWFCLNFSRKHKKTSSNILNMDRECMESMPCPSDIQSNENSNNLEDQDILSSFIAVSYTHLTLPTILLV